MVAIACETLSACYRMAPQSQINQYQPTADIAYGTWMPVTTTVVAGGNWDGATPAEGNVELIHLLNSTNPQSSSSVIKAKLGKPDARGVFHFNAPFAITPLYYHFANNKWWWSPDYGSSVGYGDFQPPPPIPNITRYASSDEYGTPSDDVPPPVVSNAPHYVTGGGFTAPPPRQPLPAGPKTYVSEGGYSVTPPVLAPPPPMNTTPRYATSGGYSSSPPPQISSPPLDTTRHYVTGGGSTYPSPQKISPQPMAQSPRYGTGGYAASASGVSNGVVQVISDNGGNAEVIYGFTDMTTRAVGVVVDALHGVDIKEFVSKATPYDAIRVTEFVSAAVTSTVHKAIEDVLVKSGALSNMESQSKTYRLLAPTIGLAVDVTATVAEAPILGEAFMINEFLLRPIVGSIGPGEH